jgi:hypothetical protein
LSTSITPTPASSTPLSPTPTAPAVSAPAATPTAAAPVQAVAKKATTQLAASTDAVALAKAFVAKYDAAVVAYLISQKSRVYNDVPALVKPFIAAEWSTLVALINYSTPVIAEAFFAAMEDAIGNGLTQLATGLVEDAVGAAVAPLAPVAAPVVAFAPAPVAPAGLSVAGLLASGPSSGV